MSHTCCGHEETARMTPNRQKVLALLQESGRPLSAYEVLDQLRAQGTCWQPPTVYRALDYLAAQGVVHYLQSLQKYVLCPHGEHDHFSQLLICVECGQVEESSLEASVLQALQQQTGSHRFTLLPQFIELKGTCYTCNGKHN